MWILVMRADAAAPSPAAELLVELGCRVKVGTMSDEIAPPLLDGRGPDVLLLEVGGDPDRAPQELRRLRRLPPLADVPTLVAVTAARVTGLDWRSGFDDFVLMPYVPQELYSRVRQLEWRRSSFSQEEILKVSDLVVDVAAHEVRVAGREVALTHQEFALLAFLMRHRGRVFSRVDLLRRVWGVEHYGRSRTVDIHMRRLRVKLGRSGRSLETVRGAGYKFRSAS